MNRVQCLVVGAFVILCVLVGLFISLVFANPVSASVSPEQQPLCRTLIRQYALSPASVTPAELAFIKACVSNDRSAGIIRENPNQWPYPMPSVRPAPTPVYTICVYYRADKTPTTKDDPNMVYAICNGQEFRFK